MNDKEIGYDELLHLFSELINCNDELLEEFATKKSIETKANGGEILLIDRVIMKFYISISHKLTSLKVLYEANCFGGAESILRSVLEAIAYMDFVLEADNEQRAKAFDLSHEIRKYNDFQYKVDNREQFRKTEIDEIEEYKSIMENDKEFQSKLRDYLQHTKNRQNYSDKYGTRFYSYKKDIENFRELCKYLNNSQGKLINYERVYTNIYKLFSREVHGVDFENLIYKPGNTISVKNVENLRQTSLVKLSQHLLFYLMKVICKYANIEFEEFLKITLNAYSIELLLKQPEITKILVNSKKISLKKY